MVSLAPFYIRSKEKCIGLKVMLAILSKQWHSINKSKGDKNHVSNRNHFSFTLFGSSCGCPLGSGCLPCYVLSSAPVPIPEGAKTMTYKQIIENTIDLNQDIIQGTLYDLVRGNFSQTDRIEARAAIKRLEAENKKLKKELRQ